MTLELTNAQCSHRQAGEMGLHSQNSWVEAGGRRQCESPLFQGSHEDNSKHREAPFPLTLGWSPGLGASCLKAKESHWESPRLASGWQAPRIQDCPASWSQGFFAPEALLPTWGKD